MSPSLTFCTESPLLPRRGEEPSAATSFTFSGDAPNDWVATFFSSLGLIAPDASTIHRVSPIKLHKRKRQSDFPVLLMCLPVQASVWASRFLGGSSSHSSPFPLFAAQADRLLIGSFSVSPGCLGPDTDSEVFVFPHGSDRCTGLESVRTRENAMLEEPQRGYHNCFLHFQATAMGTQHLHVFRSFHQAHKHCPSPLLRKGLIQKQYMCVVWAAVAWGGRQGFGQANANSFRVFIGLVVDFPVSASFGCTGMVGYYFVHAKLISLVIIGVVMLAIRGDSLYFHTGGCPQRSLVAILDIAASK